MKKKSDEIPWTQDHLNFIKENINTMPIADIAKTLGRTENCVNIKAHRLRLDRKKGGLMKEMVSRNMVIELLTQRIGSPESFRYTPEFRTRTGICQKRFWQLYRGEKNITEAEYAALSKEWKITLEDAFGMNQLRLEL